MGVISVVKLKSKKDRYARIESLKFGKKVGEYLIHHLQGTHFI